MSNPPRADGNHGGDGDKNELEKTMAKTAAVVVFSGIAFSILKTLNPFKDSSNKPKMEPLVESTQSEKTITKPPPPCCRSSQQPPLPDPLFQIPVSSSASVEQNYVVESRGKAVEIVKGDTLWGVSTRYGVSIQAIKEANGLKSDTIYAGKKLLIPHYSPSQ